jgi:hypothetical protein
MYLLTQMSFSLSITRDLITTAKRSLAIDNNLKIKTLKIIKIIEV